MAPGSDVTLTDRNPLAVRATTETFRKNNLTGTVIESDVFAQVTGTFDIILCNPPFHTGIETDYSFMERFARDARKHLNVGGEIYLVANSFLAYQPTLEKIGSTEILVDNGKFRVFKTIA